MFKSFETTHRLPFNANIDSHAQRAVNIGHRLPTRKVAQPSFFQKISQLLQSDRTNIAGSPPVPSHLPPVKAVNAEIHQAVNHVQQHALPTASPLPSSPMEIIKTSNIQDIVSLPAQATSAPSQLVPLSNTTPETTAIIAAASSALSPLMPLLPLIPPLLYGLQRAQKQKERNVYNIEMKLDAKREAKIYQFILGNKKLSRRFAIEVQAGQALQFSNPSKATEGYTPPVLFPGRFTVLVIHIEDSTPNPALIDGPKNYVFALSKMESLLIVHRNPFAASYTPVPNDIQLNLAEITKWAKIKQLFLKIHEPQDAKKENSTKIPLLPFGEMDVDKQNGDYFQVSQKNAPPLILI